MIRGGMFAVDLPLYYSEKNRQEFNLRFDDKGQFSRKVLVNNGRTATTYVFQNGIKLEESQEVLLPEYNCISVINAIEAVHAPFSFYKINKGFEIDFEDLEKKITEKTKVLYIIHYFGIPHSKKSVKKIMELKEKYNLIIVEDLTQTLLTGKTDRIGFGDYVVSSVRKWFPIADGGIAAARNDVPFDLVDLVQDEDASISKQMELSLMKKCYENGTLTDIAPYLEMEKKANKSRYIDFNPRKMTKQSLEILEKVDIDYSIEKRCSNYRYLYDKLKDISGVEMLSGKLDSTNVFVPFGLLIKVKERDLLYDYLAKHLIVGEIQWVLPTQYYAPSEHAASISDQSVMIQIDQRYDIADMDYIADTIKQFFNKNTH